MFILLAEHCIDSMNLINLDEAMPLMLFEWDGW